MKIMTHHNSARQREETPHVIKSTNNLTSSTKKKTLNLNDTAKSSKSTTLNLNGSSKKTISRSTKNKSLNLKGTAKAIKSRNLNGTAKTTISSTLKRRARSVIKDRSIDAQSRALIRYALETNDPWLAELVRRADAGETIIFTVNSLKHPHPAKRIQAKKRLKH
jgi:hypothetical protein